MDGISLENFRQSLKLAVPPLIIDVRDKNAYAAATGVIPGAIRRDPDGALVWRVDLELARLAVVYGVHGHETSHGVAKLLQNRGLSARYLDGGFDAWCASGGAIASKPEQPSVWVTRERPKIDRIACPWLIRRFIDPDAQFLYVAPSEVVAVGERFHAAPFDIQNVFWSHRGERCTFDVMIEEFGLATPPLLRLATMVRAADTDRLDLSPEAPGLLAASPGLSRVYDDHL